MTKEYKPLLDFFDGTAVRCETPLQWELVKIKYLNMGAINTGEMAEFVKPEKNVKAAYYGLSKGRFVRFNWLVEEERRLTLNQLGFFMTTARHWELDTFSKLWKEEAPKRHISPIPPACIVKYQRAMLGDWSGKNPARTDRRQQMKVVQNNWG